MEGTYKPNSKKLKLINCYGPYSDRKDFWEDLKGSGLLYQSDIIIGEDLNFTISQREIWGGSSRQDPLVAFFSYLMESMNLIDLEPIPLAPTWSNRRSRREGVAKRLDQFLISEKLLHSIKVYRFWVLNDGLVSGISDHKPIVLQLGVSQKALHLAFKYNHTWAHEKAFIDLVNVNWKKIDPHLEGGPMEQFVRSLKFIKKLIIDWDFKRKQELNADFIRVFKAIEKLHNSIQMGASSV